MGCVNEPDTNKKATVNESDDAESTKQDIRRLRLLKRAGLFNDLPPEITLKRAVTLDELRDAYELVHDVFIEEGYIRPTDSGLRMRPFEALPETATFIAQAGGEIVGVQSLIPDTPELGLPSDCAFKPELDALRAERGLVCEAASETVDDDFRKTPVPTELMRACFAQIKAVGCTDLITAISEGHADFYEMLGFEVFTPVRNFSDELNDPVLLVRRKMTRFIETALENIDPKLEDDVFLKKYYDTENPYHAHVGQWTAEAAKLFKDPEQLKRLYRDQQASD